jgi:HK97 family phage portal protein
MNWRLFFSKAASPVAALAGPGSGWTSLFRTREAFAGGFQRNVTLDHDSMVRQSVVFAAITMISQDISKLGVKLKALDKNGVWNETTSPAYSPVLSAPNSYQNSMQFVESWILSKLVHGNFYGLKVRDARNVVTDIYPLDPWRVTPLVSTDGEVQVFYKLNVDNLGGVVEPITVPAREIIHDRWNTLFHPLIGLSPLYAAAGPATWAHHVEKSASRFFQKGAQLSGVLSGAGVIDPATAARLENKWSEEMTGSENAGMIAVLGSGLEFKPLSVSFAAQAITAQMLYSGQTIASIFHVPTYKLGLADSPRAIANIEALATEYLQQALQVLIEGFERSMTLGLGMSAGLKVHMSVDDLLRMDSTALADYHVKLVGGGIEAPNEARKVFGLGPVKGGAMPYLQQQNFSLEALAKRDAKPDPFAGGTAPAAPAPAADPAVDPPKPAPTGDGKSAERVSARAAAKLAKAQATHERVLAAGQAVLAELGGHVTTSYDDDGYATHFAHYAKAGV